MTITLRENYRFNRHCNPAEFTLLQRKVHLASSPYGYKVNLDAKHEQLAKCLLQLQMQPTAVVWDEKHLRGLVCTVR